MNDWTRHPRYREIPLDSDAPPGPCAAEGHLAIVLFARDAELRSHAVKHLLNLEEFDATWKNLLTVDASAIAECISGLQKLGCPGLALGLSRPPCAGCGRFPSCTRVVEAIEAQYLTAIETILGEGVEIPRYARYHSDADGYEVFCLMPDRPAVVKASRISDAHFNLMTGYGGTNISFAEMRRIQVEKILNQARRKNIEFRMEESWGIGLAETGASERSPNPRKNKGTTRKSGKVPWRKYLEMLDDDEP